MGVDLVEKHRMILESQKFAPISADKMHFMGQLMENQDKELRMLKESGTVTADVAQYMPLLAPLIRRTYPSLIANTVAGVQALTAPSGAIFALTGRLLGKGSDANKVSPTNQGQVLVKDAAFAESVGAQITGTASTATGKIVFLSEDKKVALVKLDDPAKKFTSADTGFKAIYSNEAGFQKILTDFTGPVATALGEKEGADMKEIGITVEKVEANAKTRNLKGAYSLETLQDMKSLFGADAEQEIMNILSNEIQLEIDTEVKKFLNGKAFQCPDYTMSGVDLGRWAVEKGRALTLKIANEAREISRTSRRGPGNVLLVSPKIATVLEGVGNFVLSPANGSVNVHNAGISPVVGTFDGKYTVAVDNFADGEYFTILYKGSDQDTGVFFAPYIGLTFVKVVDPATGNPAIILKTRYDILENPLGADGFARTCVITNADKIIG